MMTRVSAYEVVLCVERGEQTIELTIRGDVTRRRPGLVSGPPEKCYPDEGGEVEIEGVLLGEKPWSGELSDRETEEAKRLLEQASEDAWEAYQEARAEERAEDRRGGW